LNDTAIAVDWPARISNAPSPESPIKAETFFKRWDTASKPILVACNDGKKYVVKGRQKGNPHARSVFNDHVAARLGRLIGVPIPMVCQVDVSAELINMNPDMQIIEPGIGHGLLFVEGATERIDNVQHNAIPQNKSRFAALAVFHAWLDATDRQFIYDNSSPNLIHSVDHGHYFGSDNWAVADLANRPAPQIDPQFKTDCQLTDEDLSLPLASLKNVTVDQIAAAVAAAPDAWGVGSSDRCAIAKHIEQRRRTLCGI
jgi:hypothetical protein